MYNLVNGNIDNNNIAAAAAIAGSKLANPLTGVHLGPGLVMALGSDAQGDTYYNNGSNVARLPAGTSGQFLQTQGAGANPLWAELGNTIVGLSSGLKLQAGSFSFTGNGTDQVQAILTFPQAFSSIPVYFTATAYAGSLPGGAAIIISFLTDPTTTDVSLNIQFMGGASQNGAVYHLHWFALGPA